MAEKYFIIVLFLCHLQQIHTLSCVHDRDCLSNEFVCDREYVYKCDSSASTCTCHPVVTTTPEPRNDIVIPIIAGCVAGLVIVIAASYGCYKCYAGAKPQISVRGATAYQPMINTMDMKNAINSEFIT